MWLVGMDERLLLKVWEVVVGMSERLREKQEGLI